jgi:hypothetical protein
MKLEEIKELHLPHYKHDSFSADLVVGGIVGKAEISTTDDAWVCGYARGGNSYHFVFRQGVSQLEDERFPGSKDEPKEFQVYIVGIVEEGKVEERKTYILAYASSRNDRTKKIHTLRLTHLNQITHIGKLLDDS